MLLKYVSSSTNLVKVADEAELDWLQIFQQLTAEIWQSLLKTWHKQRIGNYSF